MNKFYTEIKNIVRLAVPIATSAIAISMMGIVDTMMVGNYSTEQLAYVGIATAVFVMLFYIPMAMLQGVQIKSSQEFGARNFNNCGKIYRQGQKYAWWLGIIFMLVGFQGENILFLMGQSESMAVNGGKILMILSCSIPGIMQFENANFFLQSIRRQHVAMYASIAANLLNIPLNYVLVYGHWGFPEWGAAGSAVSTLCCRTFLGLALTYYVYQMKNTPKLCRRFGLDFTARKWWKDSREVRQLGWWIAVTSVLLDGSFLIVNTFAGWLGETTMAAFVIITNITGFIFMIGFSFAQSISIRTAQAFGRKDPNGMRLALGAGTAVWLGAFGFMALFMLFDPSLIFGIFTNDQQLLQIVTAMIGLILFECLIENMPLNINGALNGRGDVKIPTFFQAVSYLLVRLPMCYLFAFQLKMGLPGLYWGMICGGFFSLILNWSRYRFLMLRQNIT